MADVAGKYNATICATKVGRCCHRGILNRPLREDRRRYCTVSGIYKYKAGILPDPSVAWSSGSSELVAWRRSIDYLARPGAGPNPQMCQMTQTKPAKY